MSELKIFNFFEGQYLHELDLKEKISSRLQISMGIMLAYLSAVAYLIKDVGVEGANWSLYVYCFSLAIFIFSVWYFVAALLGGIYEFLPTAHDSKTYYELLTDTYESDPSTAFLHFENYLITYHAKCATTNAQVNEKKSRYLYECNKWLIVASAPVSMLLVLSLFGIIKKVEKDIVVKISNPVEVNYKNLSPLASGLVMGNSFSWVNKKCACDQLIYPKK